MQQIVLIRIVDDDEELADSYRFLLEGEGRLVRTYASAEDFLKRDNLHIPGCALVDVRMEGMSGLDLQARLNEQGAKLPIVFLSGHGTIDMAVDAVHSGAVSFLVKPVPLARLREAIDKAVELSLSQEKALEDELNYRSLTPKERDVADLVAEGLLNKQIADELSIAERTVQTHRTSVYRKLGVRNAVALFKKLQSLGKKS